MTEGDRIQIRNIKGWTNDFIHKNMPQCAEYTMSLKKLGLDAIKNKNFSKADAIFKDAAIAAEKLSAFHKELYEPYLYTAYFYLAKIAAFGMENRWIAIKYLKKACDVANDFISFHKGDLETAQNDLSVMIELLSGLKAGESLSQLQAEFGKDIPALVEHSNLDNSISGIGCLVFIAVFILFCIIYWIVISAA